MLVPDCTIPPVGYDVRIDLRHVVELRQGSAFDMGHDLSPPDLALTPNSLEPTLGTQRRVYWCPECGRVIRVDMSHHLRLMHMTHVCYWRCPVLVCPLWFTSELNGISACLHIMNVHHFSEGRGYSFYECLREFGIKWFGSRAFFAERETSGQSLWMDLVLARRSDQELRNSYTITWSPEFAPLRQFFKAAVDQLQLLYDEMPVQDFETSMDPERSLID